MATKLTHRGPDDAGIWTDAAVGISLGFRRLSILDLSPAGRQPMSSADGRFVIVFNGEIYNFIDLREELAQQGSSFRGASDTEVLLESFCRHGIVATLRRAWGMFALAVWDRKDRRLVLARDRVGKKPLYYASLPAAFLFGSELKALRGHRAFSCALDVDSVASYVRFGYVPAPYSIYRGVMKLQPGCLARVEPDGATQVERYWDPLEVATTGLASQRRTDEHTMQLELQELLRDSIRRRMVADVPVGAFLSGGLDSSAVVALMQTESARPVRTFTIGFDVDGYDEAKAASAVAAHLGTDHTEVYLTSEDALRVIPKLPDIYDEPFADSSQIPTYLVSSVARQQVTVALSGDGGDELFGGYTRYRLASKIWQRLGEIHHAVREPVGSAIRRLSPAAWDRWYGRFEPLIPGRFRQTLPGNKVHKLADLLSVRSPDELYLGLVSQWRKPGEIVLTGTEHCTSLTDGAISKVLPDFVDRMMFLDLTTYLPDDILTKVDRASMAVSLEARTPLLDHRVVEFAWRLPQRLKYRSGIGKWLLRKVLYDHVPRELVDRPKMGFGIPIGEWLRGPLRGWAEDMLDEARLHREGVFSPAPVRRAWQAHLGGTENHQYRLWAILMFQAWRDRWLS
jgi:asparagine synthase (glutamine-hydrolysing)